ncbi:PadR family transcriptional regulator [Bordetella holmesii F627]|nr:PadR family transcriptional regulator [Bordetella holmesii F627]
MLLALLELNPSHGYELIKAIGALSKAYYTPSPGMVYPALTYLEELGLVTVEPQGSKKRYHLTTDGLAHLSANRAQAELLLERLRHIGRKMEWMRQAWSAEPRQTGPQGEDLATGWVPEFVEARQALRQALLLKSGASPAEQRRVAAILRRTAQEIDHPPCSR